MQGGVMVFIIFPPHIPAVTGYKGRRYTKLWFKFTYFSYQKQYLFLFDFSLMKINFQHSKLNKKISDLCQILLLVGMSGLAFSEASIFGRQWTLTGSRIHTDPTLSGCFLNKIGFFSISIIPLIIGTFWGAIFYLLQNKINLL